MREFGVSEEVAKSSDNHVTMMISHRRIIDPSFINGADSSPTRCGPVPGTIVSSWASDSGSETRGYYNSESRPRNSPAQNDLGFACRDARVWSLTGG